MLEITVVKMGYVISQLKADLKHLRIRDRNGRPENFGGKTMLCVAHNNRPYIFMSKVHPNDQYCKKTGLLMCVNQFATVMGYKPEEININGRKITITLEG